MVLKSENAHCHHECEQGCAIHETLFQPVTCHDFMCPYLHDYPIHRPDVFQELLITGDMGNYIPMIPITMDSDEAAERIRTTRTVPAAILLDGGWTKVVLPLDREPDGSWSTNSDMNTLWPINELTSPQK